ncbi:MAG: ABC transporter permease [Candidatus Woesearchaeota archaeon]
MSKIISIIKKNIRLLLRSKSSALIVILGPMLIVLLVGLAFDNANIFSVNIGVFSESYNDLTNSFIDKLSEQQFSIVKSNTENECIEDIKEGRLHICIVFPPDLDIENTNASNEIVFHVDYSKINLVWAIRDMISEKLKSRSKELSVDLTDVILGKLLAAQEEIRNQNTVVVDFTNDYTMIAKEVEEIKTNLDELDLYVDIGDFHLNDISNTSDYIVYLVDIVIEKSNSALGSVASDIENLGNVSGSDSINDRVRETRNWLNDAKRIIKNNTNKLDEMVDEMGDSVGDAKGKLDTAIITRKDISEKVNEINDRTSSSLQNIVKIRKALNEIDTSVEAINVKDSETIVNPIQTKMKPVITDKSHLDYIFPGLIVLIIMFSAIILASTLVIMEKESKAYFRNFITPTKDLTFFFATYLSALIIMIAMLVIMLLITFIFIPNLIFSILTTIVILIIITTLFILIGMAIGYLFNSEMTSTLASVVVSFLLLIMSGLIFPIEGMPYHLIKIAQSNPFVVAEGLLKKSVLFNYGLGDLGSNIITSLIYIVIFLIIAVVIQKVNKKHYLSKYVKKFIPKKDFNKKQEKTKKDVKVFQKNKAFQEREKARQENKSD